jgi:hypothetical protein
MQKGDAATARRKKRMRTNVHFYELIFGSRDQPNEAAAQKGIKCLTHCEF